MAGESSILLTYMYLVVMLLVKSIPKKSVLASVIVYEIFPSLEQEDQWLPLVIDRTLALSETNRTEFSAILCQKLLRKFGRTELSVDPYSKAEINIF